VKEGDPLVLLDSSASGLAVEEARAALAVAEAQLKQVLTGSRPEIVGQAQARLHEAQAYLENAAAAILKGLKPCQHCKPATVEEESHKDIHG